MRDTTIQIGDERWRIKFLPPSRMRRDEKGNRWEGSCEYQKKEIHINKQQGLQDLLETLNHELAHAATEQFVTLLARVQAEAAIKTRLIDGDT